MPAMRFCISIAVLHPSHSFDSAGRGHGPLIQRLGLNVWSSGPLMQTLSFNVGAGHARDCDSAYQLRFCTHRTALILLVAGMARSYRGSAYLYDPAVRSCRR